MASISIRLVMDPDAFDVAHGMDRMLRDACARGTISWAQRVEMRERLGDYAEVKTYFTEGAVHCYLEPSENFLKIVGARADMPEIPGR